MTQAPDMEIVALKPKELTTMIDPCVHDLSMIYQPCDQLPNVLYSTVLIRAALLHYLLGNFHGVVYDLLLLCLTMPHQNIKTYC